jgi:hypothetical protein
LDAVSLRFVGLFAHWWVGMAARRFLDGMEHSEDRPSAVEFPSAAAPVKSKPRNRGREPGSGACPTWAIVQPDGNLQELGGTRNPARGCQEPERTVQRGSATGICDGKSSHCARWGQLVAWWRILWSGFDVGGARWRLRRRFSGPCQCGHGSFGQRWWASLRRSACDHDSKGERAAFELPFLFDPNIRVKRCFVMWSIDFGRTGRYRNQSHVVSFLSVA